MDRRTPYRPLHTPDDNYVEAGNSQSAGETRTLSLGADRPGSWLLFLRRYFACIAVANLVWETAQLPLYTIWLEGTLGEIVIAIAHCTTGDILIAGASLLGALLLVGNGRWPKERYGAVAFLASAAGLAYTIFSEWLNTEIRGSWAYTDFMPTLPLIGSGVSPLAQWIVVPLAGFWWARRTDIQMAQRLGATG